MWSLVYLLIRTLVASIIGTSKAGHDGLVHEYHGAAA